MPIARSSRESPRRGSDADQLRAQAARAFAVEAARLAANTRCHSLAILDVGGISPVTDFFVLATGTSARQMRSVADELAEFGGQRGFKAYRTDGYESANWILVDFVDVVVHLFTDDARRYYDLESLWGDAPRVEFKPVPPPDHQ